MSTVRTKFRTATAVAGVSAAAVALLVLSACSSSGSTGGSNTSGSTNSSATDNSPTGGSSAASPGVDIAAANKVLAPFVGHPSAFPANQPLNKKLPSNSEIDFLQCPTSFCVFLAGQLKQATQALGAKFFAVPGGSSVSDLQNAMTTIIAKKPAGVVLAGVDPAQISVQIKQLTSDNVPIATIGITGTDQYGIKAAVDGSNSLSLQADIQAAWAVKQHGASSNIVYYNIPELSFSNFELAEFKKEVSKLCSACQVRSVNLPVATLSTTATSAVVSDLQAHSSTNVAVFPTPSISGLTSALKTAGLHPSTFVSAPDPAALQAIKDGGLTAGLGTDIGTMTWMTIDGLAREITGQPLPTGPLALVEPMQLLEKQDITFDPSKGFLPYPNYITKFKQLWGTS